MNGVITRPRGVWLPGQLVCVGGTDAPCADCVGVALCSLLVADACGVALFEAVVVVVPQATRKKRRQQPESVV